jgi:hypothetical protein
MSSLLSSNVATVQGTSGGGGGSKNTLGGALLAAVDKFDTLRRFFKMAALACDA